MQALILAGGRGTRFWPASRKGRPKQLLPLVGKGTLLRQTFERMQPLTSAASTWVCTNRDLGEQVRRELPEIPAHQILAEPVGRNTAAAIAWSLASMTESQLDDVVVSLHSDSWITDEDSFRASLTLAVEAVEERDCVMALGVRPRWAEIGYGYIETAETVDRDKGLLRVSSFREKPDSSTAKEFLGSGRHFWNSGIFVFRGRTLLEHFRRLMPELAAGVEKAVAGTEDLEAVYSSLPAESVDTGVMERLDDLYTIALDCGWSDLGSWESLAEVLGAADSGNSTHGRVVAIDSRDNLLYGQGGAIAVLGVEGLAVVHAGDAVLVVPKSRSQEVRLIVEELRRREDEDLL